jgi:hypothetical protein
MLQQRLLRRRLQQQILQQAMWLRCCSCSYAAAV